MKVFNDYRLYFFAIAFLVIVSPPVILNAYTYTSTLNIGSSGLQVTELQNVLNTTSCKVGTGLATGYFGAMTKSAVICFQLANKLYPDGVVGPMTGAKLVEYMMTLPTSVSSTTSVKTSTTGAYYLPGCSYGTKYSITTGKSCEITPETIIVLPDGCTSSLGFSITSGVACSTGRVYESIDDYQSSSTNTSVLFGDSGSLLNVEKFVSLAKIPENEIERWFAAYTLTADQGSDLAVLSMKLTFKFKAGTASNRLNRYVKNVSIWQDGAKVGSADIGSFSRDGSVYTKNFSLSGAVIYNDGDSSFLIALDTLENIDSGNEDNTWTATLEQVRYRDAGGAILSDTSTGDIGADGAVDFQFEPLNNDD